MIEVLILIIVIVIVFLFMRRGGLSSAKIDTKRKKQTKDKFMDYAAPKNTKIKWSPKVQVREFYKDGKVADIADTRLNDAIAPPHP